MLRDSSGRCCNGNYDCLLCLRAVMAELEAPGLQMPIQVCQCASPSSNSKNLLLYCMFTHNRPCGDATVVTFLEQTALHQITCDRLLAYCKLVNEINTFTSRLAKAQKTFEWNSRFRKNINNWIRKAIWQYSLVLILVSRIFTESILLALPPWFGKSFLRI